MLNLKVQLPSGEVNVPVEPNSTPGHLKENLKYSMRVAPKLIKLTCEGRELDDIKPMCMEPNCVPDGAVLVAVAREGAPEEPAAQASSKPAAQPTMIKKEEPPKPKKIQKDVVRPTLAEGDVVKSKTLEPGYQSWKPQYVEGKQPKRHMAFIRVESTSGDKKVYPEQEESTIVFALGDPQTSPVWTAAVLQMEVGEKAQFQLPKKAVDFDLEGLLPTDSCNVWNISLVRMGLAEDLKQDFSQLLEIDSPGGKERAEDLDNVAVHWRVRRWMAEGFSCIASSRERIAILPGYGLVPIEDQNAPPVSISVGEGQQEAVEAIAFKCGPGGKGHIYLKTEAMRGNRPQGCVVIDVEVVALDACRGPGSSGWKGWQSLVTERETGDQWLDEADGRRKQLETFGMLQKSTGNSKDAEQHVSDQAHKFANNATRRYRRVIQWIEADQADKEDRKMQLEKCTVQIRLAKSSTLAHQRFGAAAEAEACADEKTAVKEAVEILKQVLDMGEKLKNDSLVYECLKMKLQVCIQGEDVPEARQVLDRLLTLRPDDEDLKSDSARINRLEGALNLKKGASTIETVQKDLQAAVTAVDKAKVTECVGTLYDMIKGGEVTWDTVRTLKVGKDVGNAMKMGDPDIAAQARKVVGEIQALAQRAGIGL